MTKITIEREGEEKIEIETDSYFIWNDKNAMWNGVDTHLAKMLEIYSELIIKKRKEAILNGNTE